MPVRIITDSGSDFLNGEHPALTVLPLTIAFGEDVYRADVDITRDRFFELMEEGDELPTTGQVNPYAYTQAIEGAQAAGEDVVIVALSSKLSGTCQSALTAAAEAKGSHIVRVVDSLNVTVGQHILVAYALRLVDEGRGADEIADELESMVGRVCLLGLLDTLEYLKRGGRIPPMVAGVGELLSIKPLFTVTDGEADILGKARGLKSGRKMLRQELEKAGGIDYSLPFVYGYSGRSDALLRRFLEDTRPDWEKHAAEGDLPIMQVGATIGTHVGPGAMAIGFFRRA